MPNPQNRYPLGKYDRRWTHLFCGQWLTECLLLSRFYRCPSFHRPKRNSRSMSGGPNQRARTSQMGLCQMNSILAVEYLTRVTLNPVCIELLYEACAFSVPNPPITHSTENPDSCYGVLRAGPLRTTPHIYPTVSVPYTSQRYYFHFGTR